MSTSAEFRASALEVLRPLAVDHAVYVEHLWVRVDVTQWDEAARLCKQQLGCTYFSFLSAIDWQPNPGLDGEHTYALDKAEPEALPVVTEPEIRKAGGSSRFQVFATVIDPVRNAGLTLVADLDDSSPAAPTWTSVYRGADWHERETWEMFGIEFTGHPGLRHIYLPAEFEGFPMRKDFALMAREVRPWPGLVDMEEMPEAPE